MALRMRLRSAEDSHSLASDTFWDQYHLGARQDGVEPDILMCKNQMWAESTDTTILSRTIGDTFSSNAKHFCRDLQARAKQSTIGG